MPAAAAATHAGASKILWHLPIIWFILAKYSVASALTVISNSAVTAVAWDSAGVTTGEQSVATCHVELAVAPCIHTAAQLLALPQQLGPQSASLTSNSVP